MSWRVAVDIGGTFTDLVAWDDVAGRITRTKVLTVPDDPVRGVVAAIAKAGLNLTQVEAFVHGSTIAINAVLQNQGATTALLTTRGFRDVLEMGRKSRPDMYNLFFKPPPCPVSREHRLEVDERLDAAGEILRPLDEARVAEIVEGLPSEVEAVAVSFIHSYANPDHERRVTEVVRRIRPDLYTCASTDVSGEAREYERTSTAVVNAYVGPLVGSYVGRLAAQLAEAGCTAPLLITQSNGGVMTADVAIRQPVRTMESGPAAGVTGAAWLGAELGLPDLIAFDMGGTSAKACVIQHGEPEQASEYRIGGRRDGLPVQVPFLDIVEVGAGGGSVARVDEGGALRVGPNSAGSEPGPACYGLGGVEPTITDANLLVGRIDPDHFLGGEMRLRTDLAEQAIGALARVLEIQPTECGMGIIRIANAIMAGAIRSVTVERGRDPRDFTLIAYGGAGALHAVSLARELRIPQVLIPAGPGTHGAFGMLVTDIRHDVARTVTGRLQDLISRGLDPLFGPLEEDASRYTRSELTTEKGVSVRFVRRMDLRYSGQFHPLTLTLPNPTGGETPDLLELFHAAHLERYGHNAPAEAVEATAMRVTAIAGVVQPRAATSEESAPGGATPASRRVMFEDGSWHDCQVRRRAEMATGDELSGPAVIEDPATNIVVGPSDQARVLAGGHILISIGGAA
jgi:N-methylhydantoinase A